MGKKSRAKRERREAVNRHLFHITIGTAPVTTFSFANTPQHQVSLAHELRLVKAALLYADKATLCSMATSMMISLLAFGNLPTRQKAEFLGSTIPILAKDKATDQVLDNLQTMIMMMDNKARLTPDQLLLVLNFENEVETLWQPAVEQIEKYLLDAGAAELLKATQTGLLQIQVVGYSDNKEISSMRMDDIVKGTKTDQVLIDYVDFIAKAVIEGDTYPLFDDMTGNLIRSAIQENRLNVTEARTARGKHSVLAGSLLERLPLFEEATMDEVLDIRKELSRPLVNFRKAVIGFSEQMKSASWDKDFPAEADQVFYKSIAPAVLEIEEQVKHSQSLIAFGERLIKKPLVSGGALSVVLSQALALPEMASIAITGGGLASATATIFSEYRELLSERKAIEQNQLYFYYKAGKLLSE